MTSHARVVEQLGRDIVSGRFEAGGLLPGDAELAQRFQVSRTVLREALKTLDAKGLISPRVRVGTSVRARGEWNHFDAEILLWYIETGIDARLLRQLQDIRLSFEPTAAALAAANASAAQTRAIVAGIETLLSGRLPAEEAVASMLDIHATVAEASANIFIQSGASLLKAALIGHFRHDPTFAGQAVARVGEAYGALAEALSQRDGEAAAAAMQAIVRSGASGS